MQGWYEGGHAKYVGMIVSWIMRVADLARLPAVAFDASNDNVGFVLTILLSEL